MHVCDLCGERLSMITSGITHIKKSILQGGLLKNCRARAGGGQDRQMEESCDTRWPISRTEA